MAGNPFKLEFTLKQHTPLIHFQHDQEGATLRATELKPKLDRFIIEHVFHNQFEEAKTYLVGYPFDDTSEKGHRKVEELREKFEGEERFRALDYKVQVKSKDSIPIEYPTMLRKDKWEKPMYPLILANMGGKKRAEDLKFLVCYQDTRVSINCFKPALLDMISRKLNHFFAINNFGNRSNKGFGSFYIDPQDKLYLNQEEYLSSEVRFEYNLSKELPSFKGVMNDIEIVYKIMKSGFNFPDHPMIEKKVNGKIIKFLNYEKKGVFQTYIKSFLFKYVQEVHNIGNDKRFIKERLFKSHVRIQEDKQDKYFVRSLLGLASFYEFKDKQRIGTVVITSKKDIEGKDIVERYASPILFKVIENIVYIIPNQNQIIENEFSFSDGFSTKKISTPKFTFDYKKFLEKYIEYFNEIQEDELERLQELVEQSKEKVPSVINNLLYCFKEITFKPHV